jgi:site-specific DNA-methyltransferase (adenine-specific)
MQARLQHAFPGKIGPVPVIGQPTEVEGARQFAHSPDGRYQFQWWAIYKVGGFPLDGERKGADLGIDGKITFNDVGGRLQTVLISVKSGQVHRGHVGELRGTIERDKAAIGILITLEEPTEPMRLEAAKAGLYTYELVKRDYPRIQILTVREILEEGKQPNVPPYVLSPYPQARASIGKGVAHQLSLPDSGPSRKVLVDQEIAQQVAESRVAKATRYRAPTRRVKRSNR